MAAITSLVSKREAFPFFFFPNYFTYLNTSSILGTRVFSFLVNNRLMTHQNYTISVGNSASSSVSSLASTVGVRQVHTTPPPSSPAEQNEKNGDLEQGNSNSNKQSENKEDEKKPGKFKVLMQQYGRVAILMYLVVSAVDLSLCVWGVWLGGDNLVFTINSYLGQYIPRLQKAAQRMEQGEGGGADKWATIFIVGYAIHKCLTPLRLGITAAILPWSARTAQRIGLTWLIPKSAPKITHKPLSQAADAVRRKLK